MAVMPGVVWRGNCSNRGPGLRTRTRGAVLHVNDGPDVSLWSWVNNPSSDMSCHFQVRVDGTIEQYLDTTELSWCQRSGNNDWISIEMPTHPDTGMSSAQIAAAARILAWLHQLYGFPLQLTSDPYGAGLGWHGMGAAAGVDWGHPDCPGDIRLAQRAQILTAAASGTTPTQEDDMPGYAQWTAADKKALLDDISGAVVNRSMGGVHFDGSLAELLANTLDQAKTAAGTLGNPASGALVRIAQLQAAIEDLPGKITVSIEQGGSGADAKAIAQAVIAEIRAVLDAGAASGVHAA